MLFSCRTVPVRRAEAASARKIDMNDTLEHGAAAVADPRQDVTEGRGWAAGAHLAALVAALATSWFAGVAGSIAALVVWLLVRNRSSFAASHAKEALNFNFSMFLYAAASVLVVVFTLGLGLLVAIPMWCVLAIAWLVFTIVATVKAWDGEDYRYPLTIRLF
jgi:hypothetical protein